ncbi:hypothetical protein QJS10_CPB13g00458 [Acorus calamus]|uniref:FRIGIDA-like protein n=1 Tax=Acorus calamus TaxID=4465 RepID=A0AAV9DGB4_ACOCL|nr:hypothetical protein QJS10_CPB13g00458 [Acorus calamus]
MMDIDKQTTDMDVESSDSLVEQLGKAFVEFESHRLASSGHIMPWEEMREHFHNLEKSLKKRLEELEEKENAFKSIQAESRAMLADREAAVAAKEQNSLDRIQELKDAAVDAILEARKKCKVESPEPVDVEDGNKEKKVSNNSNDDLDAPISAPEEVKSLSHELKQICERMDAKDLLRYISNNQKNSAAVRGQIPVALKCVAEPAHLVLDTLEGFYPPHETTPEGEKINPTLQTLRRACLLLIESAGPLFMVSEANANHPLSSEAKQRAKAIADEWRPKLADVGTDATNGSSLETQVFLQLLASFGIASEYDEDELCKLVIAISRRRQTAELCRSLGLTHKMPDVVQALINSGKQIDAVHISQAFKLAEKFPPVPLLKAYLKDLRRSFQGKGGDGGADGEQERRVVDSEPYRSENHVENRFRSFPKKLAHNLAVRDIPTISLAQNANFQELGALKAIIKCVEEYKLKAEYPLEPLHKRVVQLEKVKADRKADKKRTAREASKFQAKMPRAAGAHFPSFAPVAPPLSNRQPQPPTYFDERGMYMRGSERYPPIVPPPTYNYETQNHAASYGQYSQQANTQTSYYYPEERASVPPYPSSSSYADYTGAPRSHQSYM